MEVSLVIVSTRMQDALTQVAREAEVALDEELRRARKEAKAAKETVVSKVKWLKLELVQAEKGNTGLMRGQAEASMQADRLVGELKQRELELKRVEQELEEVRKECLGTKEQNCRMLSS